MQDIKDIEIHLDEFGDGWGEFAYLENEVIEGIDGLVSGVEHQGGEGRGEYTHVVFKIVNGDSVRHFKKVGCRVSHSGTYWDGPFTEVEQKQKVITVWE